MSFMDSVKFSWTIIFLTLICLLVNSPNYISLEQIHLFGSLVFLLSWSPSMMEKELVGSNCSLSSSYRQWAAVSANLLPIWVGGSQRKQLNFWNKTVYERRQWCTHYYSCTLAVYIVRFDVFILQKCSCPGVSINLEKGAFSRQRHFLPRPHFHQRSFPFCLKSHKYIQEHSQ